MNSNHLTHLGFTSAAGEDIVSLDYEWYEPDPNLPGFAKLITKITDTHDGVGAVGTDPMNATVNFTYDARGRLASDDLQGTLVYFGYDALGNLTHRSVGTPPTAENANQHYDDPTRPHALTLAAHSGRAYSYDSDGNVLTRGSQNVVYDSQNRLTCVGVTTDPCAETQLSYTLDGVLYRVKEDGQSRFLIGDWFEWDVGNETATSHIFALGQEVVTAKSTNAVLRTQGWLPGHLPFDPLPWGLSAGVVGLSALLAWLTQLGILAQVRLRPAASGAAVFLAVLLVPPPGWTGGGPPSFGDGGNNFLRRWIQRDHLGTAIAYTSYDGSLVKGRVFEPFGEVVASKEEPETENTAQSFTGQPLEDSVDSYNFDARWYDSEAGRFLSVDPIVQRAGDPQTANAYTYVSNSPTRFIDPDGRAFVPLQPGIRMWQAEMRTNARANAYEAGFGKEFDVRNASQSGYLPPPKPGGPVPANESLLSDGFLSSASGVSEGSRIAGSTSSGEFQLAFVGILIPPLIVYGVPAAAAMWGAVELYIQWLDAGMPAIFPQQGPDFVVNPDGVAVPLGPGETAGSSPDGQWIEVKDAEGNPTGTRLDAGHKPTTHSDPRAHGPHGHIPGRTNPDGTPWLPSGGRP